MQPRRNGRVAVKSKLHLERFALLAAAVLTLLAAMWAGLLRMDLEIPMLQPGLSLAHGPLMVCGFLGTLICLERAVALNRGWAYSAPILTALGGILLAVGLPGRSGALLIALGSAALLVVFGAVLRRQTAPFTVTMAAGAGAWLTGNLLWLYGVEIPKMVHWWAGFLILTIIGERLDLSRLSGRAAAVKTFAVLAVCFLAALVWASFDAIRGLQIAGGSLLLLTLWSLRADVARRTVRLPGLPRFIAIHLLAGYFWLAAGACLWIRADLLYRSGQWQAFHYDAMLHTIFLGFSFSMIFAHAPIVFPAITGRLYAYRPLLYAHGALLHAAVLLRVSSDLTENFVNYRWSGMLLVVAILLFLANNVASLRAGARLHAVPAPRVPQG
jgi:hypothetical protein